MMPFIPLPAEWYRRVLVADSEKRYSDGRWAYMNEAAESHRYSIIAGCCEYYVPGNRTVLDVGCGEGILQRRLRYTSYVGVDMNLQAITLARSKESENTRFVLAGAEDFQPDGAYDVIVFNESLYYIPNPMTVFNKYRAFLNQAGVIVVCMFQTNLARRLWKELQRSEMRELTAVKISNELGFASIIKAFGNTPASQACEEIPL
jgi:2-polyprenyl-3-methyl-5-hydroxy-6-metoxy-1,4-benzoquinol methylase